MILNPTLNLDFPLIPNLPLIPDTHLISYLPLIPDLPQVPVLSICQYDRRSAPIWADPGSSDSLDPGSARDPRSTHGPESHPESGFSLHFESIPLIPNIPLKSESTTDPGSTLGSGSAPME